MEKKYLNDERNITILDKTIRKTSSIMTYMLIVYLIVLSILKVSKLHIILASSLLIIKSILVIFFSNYYSKKM